MNKLKLNKVLAALAALLWLAACAESADKIKQEAKREFLRTVPDRVIIPAFRNFAAEVAMLRSGIERYCTGGRDGAELRVPQEYWRTAMTAWQGTAAYAFGPAVEYDLPALINYRAIRKSKLDYWLEPQRMASAAALKSYSVQGKGLGALEYLLFEPGLDRSAPQYCAYLSALAEDLQANADRMLGFWTTHAASPGTPGDAADSDPQQRLGELLDAALQAMETVKDEKLGVPLGRKNGGVAQPDKVESRLSGHSLRNIRANIASLQNIFYGTYPASPAPHEKPGFGFQAYLHKTGKPEAAIELEEKLRQTLQDLERLPALHIAVSEQQAATEALYRDVSELCTILATSILPAFDAQPGFNAKDGD